MKIANYNDSLFYLKLYYTEPNEATNLLGFKQYDCVRAFFYSAVKPIPFLRINSVPADHRVLFQRDLAKPQSVYSEFYLFDGKKSFQLETASGFIKYKIN
jgi:hypothetical protein